MGSQARLGMERARCSSESEHLWRTMSCPSCRHGVAFPASLRSNVCLMPRSTVHAFVLCLTMPTPTSIALAMIRKLTARWCYQCSSPCRDTPKPGINEILDDPDFVYTTHEQRIYRGTMDDKVNLLCRQVDDIAVACSNLTVAQGLIAAKIARILCSNLIQVGLPPSGLTLLYEDNKAAISMVNANRPSEGSRHRRSTLRHPRVAAARRHQARTHPWYHQHSGRSDQSTRLDSTSPTSSPHYGVPWPVHYLNFRSPRAVSHRIIGTLEHPAL
jgi:hypothetical protein